ncbi:Glutamate/Leucine/Phenylalanine/Valine dehydrogenase [Popillia japonica]|uniref:Glutamate dehydrogenase n=1 Tax=Popillia japonica TaxID=7064 RepID=A0AAW1N9N7_POPJA
MLRFLKPSLRTSIFRNYCNQTAFYDIPQRYRNAFYLANAPLFDYTNWFVHNAYTVCFPSLVKELLQTEKQIGNVEAEKRIVEVINCLEPCESLIDVNFPIKRSNGRREVVRGFRAMHNLQLYNTPCLGGMRICSDLNKDHVRSFSILSTFKHACLGIEMSGAHGGLKISGIDYDTTELKDIVVSYGRELAKKGFLGSYVDVIEPDLYCSSKEMEWIAQEVAENAADGLACAVGKPWSVGGIEIYDKCLAHGVLYALKLLLSEKKIMSEIEMDGGISGKTFIIQGLGDGAICVGVKEHDAFVYMEDGIPVKELLDYKNGNDSIQEFNKYTRPGTMDEIYLEPCDILIFAATHRSLQCYVAENVQAKIVVEAAYAPITPTAHKVLLARKRVVLPDIFAGCGASVTSYLEYVRNLQQVPDNMLISRLANLSLTGAHIDFINVNDEAKIKNVLESMMKKSYEQILSIMEEYKLGLDIRTAAYINAIRKIFNKIIHAKKY